MVMLLANLLRILLVFLALRYVWRALSRSMGMAQRRKTPPSPPPTSFESMEDVEDIDYEDIE